MYKLSIRRDGPHNPKRMEHMKIRTRFKIKTWSLYCYLCIRRCRELGRSRRQHRELRMGRSREGMSDLGRTQGKGSSLAWGGGGPELERTGRRAGTGKWPVRGEGPELERRLGLKISAAYWRRTRTDKILQVPGLLSLI